MTAPAQSGGDGARAEAPAAGDQLRAEALRVNDRYLREVVLAFGLCPWAERAMVEGQVRRAVLFGGAPAPESALPFIDELENDSAAPAIGLLIFPGYEFSAATFDGFTEKVRRADRARRPPGRRPDFVMAAFHPEAAESFETVHQLTSFLRRTPDPTIQLVRGDLLEQARAARPSVSEDVARQNHATVSARGADHLDAVLREIRRDRDESYAALAR